MSVRERWWCITTGPAGFELRIFWTWVTCLRPFPFLQTSSYRSGRNPRIAYRFSSQCVPREIRVRVDTGAPARFIEFGLELGFTTIDNSDRALRNIMNPDVATAEHLAGTRHRFWSVVLNGTLAGENSIRFFCNGVLLQATTYSHNISLHIPTTAVLEIFRSELRLSLEQSSGKI